MGILDDWISDMPQQFQNKPRIEALVKAFSKQMDELYAVFDELDTMTDLETAVGTNLDMVGDILNLSRKDAHIIIREAENAVITDAVYRQVLKYKSIANSGDCTYDNLMSAINLLWDTDNITYYEPPDRPATALLTIPTVDIDGVDPTIGKVLSIKAAGVQILYTIAYWVKILFMEYERFTLVSMSMQWRFRFYSFMNGKYKMLDGTWPLDGSVLLDAAFVGMPVSIKYGGILALIKETSDSAIRIRADTVLTNAFVESRIVFSTKVNQTMPVMYELDGSWELNGEVLLNSRRWNVPTRIDICLKNSNPVETISCRQTIKGKFHNMPQSVMRLYVVGDVHTKATYAVSAVVRTETAHEEEISAVLISKRNIWYLDGSYNLDGSRYLNAIEEKEAI